MKRVILITGASSGIGKEVALQLDNADNTLVLTGRDSHRLAEVGSKIKLAEVTLVEGDITSPGVRERLIHELNRYDKYPVLINVAGIASFGEISTQSLDDITAQMRVNFEAPSDLIRQFIPGASTRGGGQIINVLSIVNRMQLPGSAAYAASKCALEAFTKTVAIEHRKQGIRVTQVIPGAVDTPIWDGMKFQPNRKEMIPAERVATIIRQVVESPADHTVDEVVLTPLKGLL